MNTIFCQIPTLFRAKSEDTTLTIQKINNEYSLSVCQTTNAKITQLTMECLKEIVGIERLKRICQKSNIGIDIKKIDQNTLILTKDVVRKIFVGLLDIQKLDWDERQDDVSLEDKFQDLIIFNKFEDFEACLMGYNPTLQKFKRGPSEDRVDYIPTLGGVHLGEGTTPEECDIEVCYLYAEDEKETIYPTSSSFFKLVRNFLHSFSYGHCQQTTLDQFKWKEIQHRNQINEHLRMGNQLEKTRKCFAYLIHFFTFFLLNGRSFASFLAINQLKNK